LLLFIYNNTLIFCNYSLCNVLDMHYQNHHHVNQKYFFAITSVIYLSNEFLFYIGEPMDIDNVELVGSD